MCVFIICKCSEVISDNIAVQRIKELLRTLYIKGHYAYLLAEISVLHKHRETTICDAFPAFIAI